MIKKGAVVLGVSVLVSGLLFWLNKKTKAAPPQPPPPGLANLYGKVTDASTNQPIAGVQVTLGGIGQAITNPAGNYAFLNITPGNYFATFSKAGYQEVTM